MVTFRDVPESITQAEAEAAALDALETALSFSIAERWPSASALAADRAS